MSSGPLAYLPRVQPQIPEHIHGLAAGSPREAVWVNGAGVVTRPIDAGQCGGMRYVKYAPPGDPGRMILSLKRTAKAGLGHSATCRSFSKSDTMNTVAGLSPARSTGGGSRVIPDGVHGRK